ncbi:MAG TPA: nicotinamide riboside transporter PnuC [Terracidiphilus sp.]|jgi:nicotinamide mononucleotide transporter
MNLAAILRYVAQNWLELSGAVTTCVGIWLTARRNLLCWPITLAADVLYLLVFYHTMLLSDALLQGFFVAFTLYGWWHWSRGVREEGEVRVAPLTVLPAAMAIMAGVAGALALGAITTRLHAALPYLDGSLASFSLVASWWGARKHILSWWAWIAIDVLYVGEYIYKALWVTAVVYAVLVVLAVIGLREWRRAPMEAQPAS